MSMPKIKKLKSAEIRIDGNVTNVLVCESFADYLSYILTFVSRGDYRIYKCQILVDQGAYVELWDDSKDFRIRLLIPLSCILSWDYTLHDSVNQFRRDLYHYVTSIPNTVLATKALLDGQELRVPKPVWHGLSKDESDEFSKFLVSNANINYMIAAQNKFLEKGNRCPVAVLISSDFLFEVLSVVFPDRKQAIQSYYLNNLAPLCHAYGVPVYLSPKLTKSKIQVVGEIEWRFDWK